jgi:hypothetical protein
MDVSHEEVLDLLRKWQSEKHIIHCTIMVNGVYAKALGLVDNFDNGVIHISFPKTQPMGQGNFIEFPIDGSEFRYSDVAHLPEPMRDKMAGHDSVLYIFRAGDVCLALDVLPPIQEWAK